MPDLAKIAAVAATLDAPAEGAEPAPEPTAAPPAGGSLGAGSAPADGADGATPNPGDGGTGGGRPGTSPGATISHEELERKLAEDRARREEKARRQRAKAEEETAKKAREEAEAERKRAAEEREAWSKKSWKERAIAEGKNPLDVWNEMRDEALKHGTPEARLEAMEKAWAARHESLAAELRAEREAREAERKEREAERARELESQEHQRFESAFQAHVTKPEYESLTDEYEPGQLFGIVQSMRANPPYLFDQARTLGVRLSWEERIAAGEDLTDEEPAFTMTDILNVLKKTQERHFARLEEQRRKKTAAPQTGPGAPEKTKAPVAIRPTVNGTAERNAGTTLGNQLAATTAAEGTSLKGIPREEKIKRLGEKYG